MGVGHILSLNSKTSWLLLPFFVLLTIFLLSSPSYAQDLNSYSIDVYIQKDGTTKTKLVLSFAEPTNNFDLFLPFRISNFQATSTAGPIVCDDQSGDVSSISCDFQLTEDRKTVEFSFESPDMVKEWRESFLFSSDFSVKVPVKDVFAAVRLPEGMVVSRDIPGGSMVPLTDSFSSDGRRTTIVWRLSEMSRGPISFQVFYEPGIGTVSIFDSSLFIILILVSVLAIGGIIFVLFKRKKNTKEVIFSILDDYEKRIISSIEKEGGTVNQKKVVSDTNLSKAKVSRVVQKLVERGLLEVERRGRTNIIRFVNKKMRS